MKKLLINITLTIFFLGCSSTKIIYSWKNPEFTNFEPEKILVVGVTPDYEARKIFELQIIRELNAREINALQSAVVFESSFQDSKQTEKDIEVQVDKLLSNGYDTVLVSLFKGVNNNSSYGSESSKTDYHLRRFVLYYLFYQDAYFKQDYYKSYKVFNIEASMYSLNKNADKSLMWQASFDMIDPNNTTKTINLYAQSLIKALEKEKIIPTKIQ